MSDVLEAPPATRPRLGFLGLGWIGLSRMESLAGLRGVEIAALADPDPDRMAAAAGVAPDAAHAASLEGMLEAGVDAVVIATPSALHAPQAVAALEAGCAVFCQKPLGRSAAEAARVVDSARAADRLLGLDLSYRHTRAAQVVAERVRSGELGSIHAVDLVFHNAYGPDKAWFHDPALAGGGCVMDLGIHLVDLALWTLGFPAVERVEGQLHHRGERIRGRAGVCEDHATATLELEGGAVVRLACSWGLHAGRDAVIRAGFHGTRGAAEMRNVEGSFYDLVAERYRGTSREVLASPPDDWGGRALRAWADRLVLDPRFDEGAAEFVRVAEVLDRIYGEER
jgi:predicted dehydrogenase